MRVAGRFTVCAYACFVLSVGVVTCLTQKVGCQPVGRLTERETSSDLPLFVPTDLRIHPFTAVKDWTGDNKPDGVEVLLELQDRFRDPTKATGTVLFELYEFRKYRPTARRAAGRVARVDPNAGRAADAVESDQPDVRVSVGVSADPQRP